MHDLTSVSNDLLSVINSFYAKHKNLPNELASINLDSDKWSLKEIIGHLIDSASNNHQRFVRLQIEETLNFPSYHYSWIEIEKFNSVEFKDLITLWKHFNVLLAHLIRIADESALKNVWEAQDQVISLENLMVDYLRHLKEHLNHFEQRLQELESSIRS